MEVSGGNGNPEGIFTFPDRTKGGEETAPRALHYDRVPFTRYGKITNLPTWDKDIVRAAIEFKREYDKWPTALLASTETYDMFDKYVAEQLGRGDEDGGRPPLSPDLVDNEDDWDDEDESAEEESNQLELFGTEGGTDAADSAGDDAEDADGDDDGAGDAEQLDLFQMGSIFGDDGDAADTDSAGADDSDGDDEDNGDDDFSEDEDEFLDMSDTRNALDEDAAERLWKSYDVNKPLDEITPEGIPMSYGETFETPLFSLQLLLDENLALGIFRMMYGEGPTDDDGEELPEVKAHTA